jgi:hypothetical protein
MRVSRLMGVLCLLLPQLVYAEPLQHEFLLFSSAEAVGVLDRSAPSTGLPDDVLKADLLFSLQYRSLKLFGEYLLTDHEADLERFQFGWQMSEDTILWLGRYHQPSSVWNHEHHHGQYLSTSITRPAIEEWEDGGGEVGEGVLPQHFTGMLIESSRPVLSTWSLRTAVGTGISPVLTPRGMRPFDLLRPSPAHGQAGFQAKAALFASEFSESGAGLLLAYDDLNAVGWPPNAAFNFDRVDLTLYGVFGTYADTNWKLTGTVYYTLANIHSTTPGVDRRFVIGYVQAERQLQYGLTAFARVEDSSGAGASRYLHLYREFAKTRYVTGLRWDFAHHQALTVQATDTRALVGHFKDVRLQWSAALF